MVSSLIGTWAYGIGFVVHVSMLLLMVLGWRFSGGTRLVRLVLLAVLAVTALWCLSVSVIPLAGPELLAPLEFTSSLLDLSRSALWVIFIMLALDLLKTGGQFRILTNPLFLLALFLALLGIAQLVFDIDTRLGIEESIAFYRLSLLGLTLIGIVLVENLFQLSRGDAGWVFKHLIIAAAMLMAFELAFHVHELLMRQVAPAMSAARSLVAVLVLPLILLSSSRTDKLSFNVALSQDAAFHTTTLVLAGLYLMAVSLVGYIIGDTDVQLAPLLQILLLVGAILVLAVVLLSGKVRAQLRMMVVQNFFALHYDYRREWLRFIRRMTAEEDDSAEALQERAVRALADIFECVRGALFIRRQGPIYPLSASYNMGTEAESAGLPGTLIAMLEETDQPVINLRSLTSDDMAGTAGTAEGDNAAPHLQKWMQRMSDPWLLVPLRSRDQMVGAILLSEPRVHRELTWEDRDLLEILGVQVASYIVQDEATRALLEAQRFEQVSKNFSFVAHDLKNLVSQLSLVVQNFEKHGENPEFRHDALETIGLSVEKMRAMMVRLKEARPNLENAQSVDVSALVRDFTQPMSRLIGGLTVNTTDSVLPVRIDPLGFGAVLDNMLQNAVEATGADGVFEVGARSNEGRAEIWVSDNGPGMSEEFIEKRLYKPFSASKKSAGFGLGLYQTREFVERYGGQCKIESREGEGTTVRLFLPLDGVNSKLGTPPPVEAISKTH